MAADHPETIAADAIIARNVRYAWCKDVIDVNLQKVMDRLAENGRVIELSYTEAREFARQIMPVQTPHDMRGEIARLKSEIEMEAEHLQSLIEITERKQLEFDIIDLNATLAKLRETVAAHNITGETL